MKAMILAAGRGSRMGSLTEEIPKPLTKIGNLTLIEHNIFRLKKSGITNICINVSYLGNQIRDYLKTGKDLGVDITYMDEEDNMLGTGGGILNAIPFLGDKPFWLVNADLYSDFQIPRNFNLKPSFLAHLILVPNPEHNREGDFYLKKNKVSIGPKNRPYTYSGISFLSPELFKHQNKKIFPLEPILEENAKAGNISGEFYDGLWSDIGTKERLQLSRSHYKNRLKIS